MIKSVRVERLRGIEEGELTDLAPLTILVGANGSGKSAILDALLIGGSKDPARDVGLVAIRRPDLERGAEWLFFRKGGSARVVIVGDDYPRTTDLNFHDSVSPNMFKQFSEHRKGRASQIDSEIVLGAHRLQGHTAIADDPLFASHIEGSPRPRGEQAPRDFFDPNAIAALQRSEIAERRAAELALQEAHSAQFLDPRPSAPHGPISDVFTRVVQNGRREVAVSAAKEVISGLSNIEILAPGGKPVVHLVFDDHAIPLGAAGDGIRSLLRLVLELAICPGGTVLLEEPEVHQHPGAIFQTAKAILATVRRGVQVVLTTHSLDLIDALLAQSEEDDLARMCTYRLRLDNGKLKTTRIAGVDVAFERTQVQEDLR